MLSNTATFYPTQTGFEFAEAFFGDAGRYYSDELEAAYTVAVENGRLVARHRRAGDAALSPVSEGRFRGDQWYFEGAAFERDAAGSVTGVRVSSASAACSSGAWTDNPLRAPCNLRLHRTLPRR